MSFSTVNIMSYLDVRKQEGLWSTLAISNMPLKNSQSNSHDNVALVKRDRHKTLCASVEEP